MTARRDPGVMVWKMHETRIPPGRIEPRRPAPVTPVTGGGQRVQHEDRRRPGVRAEEQRMRPVIGGKSAPHRRLPAEDREPRPRLAPLVRVQRRRRKVLGRRQPMALLNIRVKCIKAPPIEQVPALDSVHHHAHRKIKRVRELPSDGSHGDPAVSRCSTCRRRRVADCGMSSSVNSK